MMTDDEIELLNDFYNEIDKKSKPSFIDVVICFVLGVGYLAFGVGCLAAAFTTIACIIHFQILYALGTFFLAVVCWYVANFSGELWLIVKRDNEKGLNLEECNQIATEVRLRYMKRIGESNI